MIPAKEKNSNSNKVDDDSRNKITRLAKMKEKTSKKEKESKSKTADNFKESAEKYIKIFVIFSIERMSESGRHCETIIFSLIF